MGGPLQGEGPRRRRRPREGRPPDPGHDGRRPSEPHERGRHLRRAAQPEGGLQGGDRRRPRAHRGGRGEEGRRDEREEAEAGGLPRGRARRRGRAPARLRLGDQDLDRAPRGRGRPNLLREERLESGLYSRSYLENQMAVAMGGRIAEELIFGADNVTTGASGDFMQVSRTAKQMVTQVGYGGGGGPSFLGQQMGQSSDFSGKTAALID